MNCYTVDLRKVINGASPIPQGMITEGIAGKIRPDGKVAQMFLGQPGWGCVEYVDASFTAGAEMVQNKFMSAGLITARVGNTEKWFLTKPEGKSTNILVRIVGKTERDLGLIIGGFTDGVEPIAIGSGKERSGNEWCDALVVIPPYAAIFVAKDQKDIIAIVNCGGGFLRKELEPAPIAITPEEYKQNFLPHMLVTLVDPKAETQTVTAPEIESTPAVTQTKTAQTPAVLKNEIKPAYANSQKPQPKLAAKTKPVEAKKAPAVNAVHA